MGQAWLDDLSESWVSQNGSDTSHCAAAESTADSRKPSEMTSSLKSSPSRSLGSVRHFQSVSPANSSHVLSERSANEINMSGSRHGLSKLSRELKAQDQSNLSQRSETASAAGSVIHNTVERKSHSKSQTKGGTPEWRRRIVEGDLGFGEQRDLFSPTRLGLENIFQPPQASAAEEAAAVEIEDGGQRGETREDREHVLDQSERDESVVHVHQYDEELRHDITMPSSPPVSRRLYDLSYNSVDDSAAPELPQQPRRFLPQIEERSDMPDLEERDDSAQSAQSVGIDESVQRISQLAADTTGVSGLEDSKIHEPTKQESRIFSGQSVLRNESFSAILISPEKKDGSGGISGQTEVPHSELQRRLENLRWNQMALTKKADDIVVNESVNVDGKFLNAENTEDYEKMGGFINFRRGGRSADGSFRNRMLSPSLDADTSEMLPEESLQASTPKQFPTIRTERATLERQHITTLPRVPNPSPEKLPNGTNSLLTAGGSPLKLFGPYDTYTNQTLLRRISQFEDQMSNGSQLSVGQSVYTESYEPSRPELESVVADSTRQPRTEIKQAPRQSSNQFGSGELDGYSFSEDFSEQVDATVDALKLSGDKFPKLPFFSEQSELPLESQGELHVHRQRSSGTTGSSMSLSSGPRTARLSSTELAEELESPETPRRSAESGSEKRPRTSPSKDPTPKRRRTLHKSDIAFRAEDSQAALSSVHASHLNMQSIVGRKRRDAREGDEFQSADPDVLASRLIRWPHAPTSSRRSSANHSQNSADVGVDGQDGNSHLDDSGNRSWQSSASNSHVAAAAGTYTESDRKPSIRTEDFMNEANKIMAMLRNRGGGIQSGLASLEESEMETPVLAEQSDNSSDVSFQESTKEPFSRPPSREGKPVPRVTRVQEDPEVVARLKKYAERSEMDDLVSSTTRSINLAQDAILAERKAEQAVQDTIAIGTSRGRTRLDDSDVVSDPPNIRISENPNRARRGESPGVQSGPGSGLRDRAASQVSQGSMSSGVSTGRSVPTGSSRGSESRKTIAPETVSHLIPDQVGNMMLDRDNNIWIKRRSGSSGQFSGNILPSEGSEEDPFADIPDLSVDVTMELHNLKALAASAAQETARVSVGSAQSPDRRSGPTLVPTFIAAAPNERLATDDTSDGHTDGHSDSGSDIGDSKAPLQDDDDIDGAVEHEISIDEGREPKPNNTLKKRHLAISFSSPIASIIQDIVTDEDDNDNSFRYSGADRRTTAIADDVSISSVQRGRRRAVSVKFRSTETPSRSRSTSRSAGPARKFSLAGRAFVSRPVSRIEEREEDSTDRRLDVSLKQHQLSVVGEHSTLVQVARPGEEEDDDDDDEEEEREAESSAGDGTPRGRRASISVLVTTPGERAIKAMTTATATVTADDDDEQVMAQYVGMMSLSPMSEFTIHHDRSLALEASYVHGSRHLVTGDESTAVMSQSLRSLVERLAEVEPSEPFWEDLEDLDVQNKRLESLHKLDEFCPQLVTLDAAGNALRNLSGVPATVRHLRAVGNQLSELTSWTSLANLQYLDISSNAIKTLAGLRQLVHLRGLKADNCSLADLEGIKYHDGLQTLRARGNQIRAVDFAGTRLQKLVELDLEDNEIESATNLDQLGSLAALSLRRNALGRFTAEANGVLPHLRTLNVSDNRLEALDVRGLPALRTLLADRNRLAAVRGFSKTPRLDSVSLREQNLVVAPLQVLDLSSLYHAYEIRKLYLSGNRLESFDPPVDFLNLQLLELASCGLTSLPRRFGLAAPNLRKLNLNFNALADLRCLDGIFRLKKLQVAGNRLARAHTAIQVLAGLPHLAEADLRDNPLTQGFYAPVQVVVAASGSSVPAASAEAFSLPLADEPQDQAYCRRLDLATGMRRRVYEQVVGEACKKLKQLDGLAVRRDLGAVRDAVWEALNVRGIVGGQTDGQTDSQTDGQTDAQTGSKKEAANESRWGAEDTFA